jgi:hypothetical protein
MSTVLPQLLEQRSRLEAEAAPLRERLARCDAAIEAADRAQQLRDRLLAQHDRTVADCIANGRHPPPMDPELDQAEIALRRVKSAERGALLARERIQEELAALNAQLSAVAAELDEATWASVPQACAAMFEQAERSRREFEGYLAAIDSVASYAHQQAHVARVNGGSPEQSPAFHCWGRLRQMVATLTGNLGANAIRDFRTGSELLRKISEGRAQFGDVSRWEPPSQAAADGSVHINRGEPLGAPVARDLPPPLSTSEGEMPAPASPEGLPDWLEPSTPTFMPAPGSGKPV